MNTSPGERRSRYLHAGVNPAQSSVAAELGLPLLTPCHSPPRFLQLLGPCSIQSVTEQNYQLQNSSQNCSVCLRAAVLSPGQCHHAAVPHHP